MGLKDQPEFEEMESASADQKAGAEETTAVTQRVQGAVGAAHKRFQEAYKDKEWFFNLPTVESLSLNTKRIKGEQGSLFMDNKDLGSEIQFEIVSYNVRWAIGTGEKNDKESKEYFRVSYDNRTISGKGMLVEDYLNDLRAQGFKNAKCTPYLDIWGFVTWSKVEGVTPEGGVELVMLQCSQTSKGAFVAFTTAQGLLESRGLVKLGDIIEVHAERQSKGDNKYTNFSFHTPKAK